MNVPVEIVCTVVASIIALQTAIQAWTLKELVRLKERFASMETHFQDIHNDTQHLLKKV